MDAINYVYAKASHLGSTVTRLKPKGLDGIPNKQWSMWFNAMIRAKSYQSLKTQVFSALAPLIRILFLALNFLYFYIFFYKISKISKAKSGVAWLSTARAVRCRCFIKKWRLPFTKNFYRAS